MKIRRPGFLYVSIVISIALLLVNGCASTHNTVNNSTGTIAGSEEPLKELRVSEFILGAGDTIEVSVYRHDDLSKSIKINSTGVVTFPLVGDVKASGLGLLAFRDKLRDGLSKYIVDPQVSVDVSSVQSKKYSVLGEVNRPGLFSLEEPVNILQATANAGGFTNDAKLETILVIRGGADNPLLLTFNAEDAIDSGDFSQMAGLRSGDIVYVPATRIADASRYFSHISKIILPFIAMESAYFTGQQIEGARGTASLSR